METFVEQITNLEFGAYEQCRFGSFTAGLFCLHHHKAKQTKEEIEV